MPVVSLEGSNRRKDAMQLHISTRPLTEREWEEIEEILLEEMEIQQWYGITALAGYEEDVIVLLQ